MRGIIKNFMREHKTILALKKAHHFYFLTLEKCIQIIILITIYSLMILSYLYLNNFKESFSFIYYSVVFGTVFITYVSSISRDREFQKENEIEYEVLNNTIINIHSILLIVMTVLSVYIVFYYHNMMSTFDLVFHTVLITILMIFEFIKYATVFKYLDGYFLEIGKAILFCLIVFDIVASMLYDISIVNEFLIVTIVVVYVYFINVLLSKIPHFNKYAIYLLPVLIIVGFFIGNNDDMTGFENSGYVRIEETPLLREDVISIVENDNFIYVQYYERITVYNELYEIINEYDLDSVNKRFFLYEDNNKVYLYSKYLPTTITSLKLNRLYEVNETNINLIFETEAVTHQGQPFFLDGNFTYIVSKDEAYQIIEDEAIELREVYDFSDGRNNLYINDEVQVFYENGSYYYYSSRDFNYDLYYLSDGSRESDSFCFYYDEDKGLYFTGSSGEYNFYKNENQLVVYKNGEKEFDLPYSFRSSIYGIKRLIEFDDYKVLILGLYNHFESNFLIILDEKNNVVYDKSFDYVPVEIHVPVEIIVSNNEQIVFKSNDSQDLNKTFFIDIYTGKDIVKGLFMILNLNLYILLFGICIIRVSPNPIINKYIIPNQDCMDRLNKCSKIL